MSYEGIHNVHKIKIAHDSVKETGRKTIDLTAQFDVTAWSNTPTLTEKEITFFLAESFEGIVFDKEPSSLEDRKAAAQETVAMLGESDHAHDLIMYIAELYRRLEMADLTFSLDG